MPDCPPVTLCEFPVELERVFRLRLDSLLTAACRLAHHGDVFNQQSLHVFTSRLPPVFPVRRTERISMSWVTALHMS